MGSSQSRRRKSNSSGEKEVESLKGKIRLLQKEIKDIMTIRENENQDYNQEILAFSFKEAEWKAERRRMKEEVKKLRKKLEERNKGAEKEMMGSGYLLEQMKEEKTLRDEAVERWKQLYLAIKHELDDLILRTNQEGLCWRAEEAGSVVVELQRELKDKEETIKVLQAQLASMEQEISRWQREVDILRQSLRIMSYKHQKQQPSTTVSGIKKSLHLSSIF